MDFSVEKKLPFEVITYSDAKKLLLLMENVLHSCLNIDRNQFTHGFQFHNGEISCSTNNRRKFVKESFGVTDFSLTSMSVSYYRHKSPISLSLRYFCGLSINSTDKELLARASDAYDNACLRIKNDNKQASVVIQNHGMKVTQIDQSSHVQISGNMTNSVIGHDNVISTISNGSNEQQSGSFWKPILQSVVTKIIIGLLTSAAAVLLGIKAFFGGKG